MRESTKLILFLLSFALIGFMLIQSMHGEIRHFEDSSGIIMFSGQSVGYCIPTGLCNK